MTVLNNRVKVNAAGVDDLTDFFLGSAVESFTSFVNGIVKYTVVSASGKWQVGTGEVSGLNLTRGTVEENYLGTTDQIDFTGEVLQIAQTLSAEYINEITDKLATIESGSTTDQTGSEIKIAYESEADTNAFTDILLTKLNSVENSAKDDQIASEVPVTPVGDLVATNVQSALQELDNDLTTHTQDASTVVYDPTDDPTSLFTNVQTALVDHGTSIEQRVSSCSGIITGGLVTGIAGGTTFTVEAGSGEILNSYTDPSNTSIIEQTWDEFPGIALTPEIGTQTVALIRVFIGSSAGVPYVVKKIGIPTPDVYRDHIFLGAIWVIDGVIGDIIPAPSVVKQTATDAYDLLQSYYRISGGLVLSVSGALSVWQQAGSIFFPGVNWFNDRKNPNNFDFADTSPDNSPDPRTPLPFNTISQTGLIVAYDQTLIPKFYDVSGTITALPGNKAVIHRLYTAGFNTDDRTFFLQYGQTLYDSADVAKNALLTDVMIAPTEIASLDFVGYICIFGAAVDFADASKAWIISGENNQVTSTATINVTPSFLSLEDTPTDYAGEAGKYIRVTVGEDGLEFGSTSGVSVAWGDITGTLASQADLQAALDAKEPVISVKYSAFNTDFGLTGGTTCEGNDSRLSDARTPTPHNHNEIYYTESEVDVFNVQRLTTVSETSPSSPVEGQKWLNSATGITYTWYAQGSGQWLRVDSNIV